VVPIAGAEAADLAGEVVLVAEVSAASAEEADGEGCLPSHSAYPWSFCVDNSVMEVYDQDTLLMRRCEHEENLPVSVMFWSPFGFSQSGLGRVW
jgi:hypothetical protein